MTADQYTEIIDSLAGKFDAIDVCFGRFDVDFGAVILDHGLRLRSLEGSGGS